MAGDAPGTSHENPASPGVAAATARLALYRRYRPATFAEVRGQEHVTEPLRQALRNGRVHHAYLFSGPRGCGKTSSARILARSLNCAKGPTPDPCGECESCVSLAPSGPGSIDVIEIDAASHGGVDDARDLRERAFYAPVSGRFKVYIIDEAHMVTREGFNALLRLVEEPPPHLKFVFATTEPEKVIATIRSRTHHYPFRLVPPAVLRELLEEILAAEGVTYQQSVLPLVVRAGAGSVRDSLSVLDQLLAGAGEEGLTYDTTAALLGYSDDSLLDEMVEALAVGDGAAVFGAVDRAVQGGHDPRRFAADLLDRLRDLIILAAVPGAAKTGLLDAPDDRLERMTGQAGSFGQAELARAAEILSDGLIQMRGTTSPRLLFELMCAQVLLPAAGTSERALLARLEQLERRVERQAPAPGPAPAQPAAVASPAQESGLPGGRAALREAPSGPATSGAQGSSPSQRSRPGPSQEPQPDPSAAATGAAAAGMREVKGPPAPTAGPVSTDTVRQRWPDILDAVRGERRVAWILLSGATVQSLEGGVLTVAFPREGEAKGFTTSGCDQVLVTAVSTLLGMHVRVRAAVAGEPPPPPAGAAQGGHPHGPGGSGGGHQHRPADPPPGARQQRPPRRENPGDQAQDAHPGGGALGQQGPTRSQQGPARRQGTQARRQEGPVPGQGGQSRASSAAPAATPPAATPPAATVPGRTGSGRARGAAAAPSGPPHPQPSAGGSAPAGEEWPDDIAEPGAGGGADGLTGMELIQRQLGGRIIEEIDEA